MPIHPGEPYDVSVIVSTHNRCDLLARALDSLLAQEAAGTRYEIFIVDNASSDRTANVVRSRIAAGHANLRLLFEPAPGASHGRNAGIRAATAPILAFTDDDAAADRHWIANIRRAFEQHPDVDYISGKVLPSWERTPPRWLTSETWGGPCVIRDRGDEAIYSAPGSFFPGWATVNLAVRRRVFERVGLFFGEFARGEDLEFILRVWRANGRGMYAPDVAVEHLVPAERMTRQYHRAWHVREGEIRARLRYHELFEADGRLCAQAPAGRTVLGTSGYVYRRLLGECRGWLVSTLRRTDDVSFGHECQVRQLVSYIRARARGVPAPRPVEDVHHGPLRRDCDPQPRRRLA